MAPGTRARSAEELTDLINQALDEVEDLRAAIEYDEEYAGESSIIVEPVSAGLSSLLAAINDDKYQPGEGEWMNFIDPLRDIDHRAVPFWPLLKLILETHEKGFRSGDEEA
jgi:hypothetical protein